MFLGSFASNVTGISRSPPLLTVMGSGAPSPGEPADLAVRDIPEAGAESLVVAPVDRVGLGATGCHRDRVVVEPERVALVQPGVGQALGVSGASAEVVAAPTGPPGVGNQISEGQDHPQAMKGALPRRDDVASQFEAVASVDAQVFELVVAEARLVGAPGAAVLLPSEETREDVGRTG